MKFICEAELIGFESRISAKGNSYTVALFVQGVDVFQPMLPDNTDCSKLKLHTKYSLTVDYNSRFRNMNLIDMKAL